LVLKFSNACWNNSSFMLIFFSNRWNQQKLTNHLTFVIYQCWADIKNWLKIVQKFQAGFKLNTFEYSLESYRVWYLFIVSENQSLEIMSLLICNRYPIKVLKISGSEFLISTFNNYFRCYIRFKIRSEIM
jgi:hypothetical protein